MSFDIKDYRRHPPNTTALLLETFHRKENCFIVAATFPRVKVTQTSSNCRRLLKVTRLPCPLWDRVLKYYSSPCFHLWIIAHYIHNWRECIVIYSSLISFSSSSSLCIFIFSTSCLSTSHYLLLLACVYDFFPDLGKYFQDSPTQRESRVWPRGRWADTGSLLATPAGTQHTSVWHAKSRVAGDLQDFI